MSILNSLLWASFKQFETSEEVTFQLGYPISTKMNIKSLLFGLSSLFLGSPLGELCLLSFAICIAVSEQLLKQVILFLKAHSGGRSSSISFYLQTFHKRHIYLKSWPAEAPRRGWEGNISVMKAGLYFWSQVAYTQGAGGSCQANPLIYSKGADTVGDWWIWRFRSSPNEAVF